MPQKPSDKEEEYFARLEAEKKKKLEEQLKHKLELEQKSKLRDLHYMHCPKCGLNLIEVDYKKVKIDKCNNCGGIWLDANELDEIIKLEQSGLKGILSIFKKQNT